MDGDRRRGQGSALRCTIREGSMSVLRPNSNRMKLNQKIQLMEFLNQHSLSASASIDPLKPQLNLLL